MRALRKINADTELRLCEAEMPVIGEKDLLVQVAYAGICGTDLHILHNQYAAHYPVTLGHEFSGVVAAAGAQVEDFSVGDAIVSMTPIETCGHCRYCLQDLRMLCRERRSIGSGADGAFADFIRIPSGCAFHIPPYLPLKEAALLEPIACCVRAVIERSKIRTGDTVYVSGPGLMGQIVAQLARVCGAAAVIGGVAQDQARLHFAASKGFQTCVVSPSQRAQTLLDTLNLAAGFDGTFECSGYEASAALCLALTKKCGFYAQVGLFGRPVMFHHDLALVSEIDISNSYAAERTSWEIALKLLENKKLDLEGFADPIYELEAWQTAFQAAQNKRGYKVMFCLNDHLSRMR